MKNIVTVLFLLFLPASVFAKEPVNLAFVKQELIQYHDSGQYQHDLANVIRQAMDYLKLRMVENDFHGKKPAIVLDIDETALSNYPNMIKLDFGGTLDEIREAEDKGTDEVIKPTLELYRFCQSPSYRCFFHYGTI